jgi:ferric-dicitrate binding protein FerR (iron transport regulator)
VNEGPHIDSTILARYLSGGSDAAERSSVEQWAERSEANAAELELLRTLWEDADHAMPEVDVDAAWAKVSGRIAGPEERGRVIPIGRTTVMRWLAAAAVLIGLFVGVRYLIDTPTENIMASTEPIRATLSDSSNIVLYTGSRITADMKGQRNIALRGAAYFEVKRDVERPFVVEADGVTVTVLGTAFEVNAFDTAQSVLVRVRHGKVRVVAGGDTVILDGGGYARYNKAAHLLERMPAPPSAVWGERILQFQEAPLAQVVGQLERLYDVRVQFANETISRCTLTATFEDEPIEYILRIIADTYGFELIMEAPGSYLLEGDGC